MGTNLQLVVCTCTQFLKETKCKGRFTPTFDEDADKWYQCKKDHHYSLAFETMSQEEYEALFDDTANADFLQEAAFLLRRIQQQVKAWIKSVDKDTLQLKHLPDDNNENGEISQDSTPTFNTATYWEQFAADKNNDVAHDWVDWKRK